ncbi:MAG TPA: hypothetical protein VEH52_03425 [Gaiellaceae bacterium]|nr:hypothetical protein [Gaiellaceae bacterium]
MIRTIALFIATLLAGAAAALSFPSPTGSDQRVQTVASHSATPTSTHVRSTGVALAGRAPFSAAP